MVRLERLLISSVLLVAKTDAIFCKIVGPVVKILRNQFLLVERRLFRVKLADSVLRYDPVVLALRLARVGGDHFLDGLTKSRRN